MDKHLANVCPENTISCELCNAEFKRKEKHLHIQVCPEGMMQCAHCDAKFKRKENPEHNCVVYLRGMLDTSTDMFAERLAEKENEIRLYWENLAKNPISKQQMDEYDQKTHELT